MLFFAGLALALAQPGATPDNKAESKKHGRMEQVNERGRKILRFFDKDGKKKREIALGETEVRAQQRKDAPYDAAKFGLKISSTVAEAVESARKEYKRGIVVMRRILNDAEASGNGTHLVVKNLKADFIEYADTRSDEDALFGEAVDTEDSVSVYDQYGEEVLNLKNYRQGVGVSNTGRFFIIADEENGRILNNKAEVILEVPVSYENEYFSVNDRFFIFTTRTSPDKIYVSVYDTLDNKFEPQKVVVDSKVFKNIEKMDISESSRVITITHFWDIKTREIHTDTVRF